MTDLTTNLFFQFLMWITDKLSRKKPQDKQKQQECKQFMESKGFTFSEEKQEKLTV